ncbi:MAG: YARHG domain-containing protein [Coriobacteriales bacterium]|nr:YARHG domain-containing protein [Coriobacteriales bacterium]
MAQTEPVHEKKRTDLKYRVIIALSIVLIVAAVTVTALVLLGVIRLPQNSSDVAETPLTAPVSEPSEPSSPIEEDPIGQAQPGPSKPDADADSKAPSNDQSDSDYIFADSASRYLSRSEIMPLSQWEMLIARNEIYARHGRGFTTPELANYFRAQSWYHERYSATEFDAMGSVLNDYEEKNALLILEIERELGYM